MKKKAKAFRLALILLAFSMIPAIPANAAVSQVKAYSDQSTARQITEDVGVMGMRVKLKVPVSGVAFSMPTWSVSGKYSAVIAAYKWQGSYEATVASAPIAEKQFTALNDNATNWLYFEKPEVPYTIKVKQNHRKYPAYLRKVHRRRIRKTYRNEIIDGGLYKKYNEYWWDID